MASRPSVCLSVTLRYCDDHIQVWIFFENNFASAISFGSLLSTPEILPGTGVGYEKLLSAQKTGIRPISETHSETVEDRAKAAVRPNCLYSNVRSVDWCQKSMTLSDNRRFCLVYRVGQKSKPTLSTHNFVKYWPIFKIFSLSHSPGNLQQSDH